MKNSKKPSSAKLTLSKETLRHLDAHALKQAAGGMIPITITTTTVTITLDLTC